VILGHSERRDDHGETSALVAAKVETALAAGLEPIVCVGESLAQREAGSAIAVVTGQIRESLPASLAGQAFAVAYEPIWAIGTGRTATVADIAEMHAAIRAELVGDVRRARRDRSDSLRRLGEARQRRRDPGRGRGRRGAGRRRVAEGDGLPGDHRGGLEASAGKRSVTIIR
jgi:hypothetical protein